MMNRLDSVVASFLSYITTFKRDFYVAFAVFVVVYFVGLWARRARSNFPPGPYGLPILGYLPFFSKNAHFDFMELGKKYGDVFSINFGLETVVIVHGVEAIKETLSKPELLGRPSNGLLKFYNEGKSAFFMDDFQKWKEHRRFMVRAMKDLGLGKSAIEGEILDEIRHFIDIVRKNAGKPMDLKKPLSPSMSNNICLLVFGKRYEYDNPDRVYLDWNLEAAFESFSTTSTAAYFPWIMRIPLVRRFMDADKTSKAFMNIKNFFREEIKTHMETLDLRHVRDFVDSFLVEMASRRKKNPNTSLSNDSLACDVLDIFVAGSETVRTSILWSVCAAAAFPDAQDRIREEILEVMGPDRDPEFQDMKRMPFTHSYILEIQRWQTIVPIGVPHCTLSDATIGEYDIPKNTTVITNLWHAHRSPDYWTDPDIFIPDRFVTKDGRSVSTPSHFMPFSMGKRTCPGEAMAMMEMFLYFTSILQKFQVVFPEGYTPTYKAELHSTYRMDPYQIIFRSLN